MKFIVEFEEEVIKHDVVFPIQQWMGESKKITKSGIRNGIAYRLPHGFGAYMWKTEKGNVKLRIWKEG